MHADDMHLGGTIEVPAWLAGEPKLAVALYFFGYADATRFITSAVVE